MDNRPLVFANGCFDLLHPGHLSLLEFCSNLGRVVVGLNSDDSVRKLKGESRPIIPQNYRKFSLEACRWVDEVIIFEEDTPLNLIRQIQPDIIVKGAEYRGQEVVGGMYAKVVFFDPVNDFSTSRLVQKIREA